MDGAVCPGVDVVYNCTTDDTTVRWTAAPYFIREPLLQFGAGGSTSSGPITISPLSRDPFTSTLTIDNSYDLDSIEVNCDAGSDLNKSITYRRFQGW